MAAGLDGVENSVRMMLLKGNGNSPEFQSAAYHIAKRVIASIKSDGMSRKDQRAAAFRYVRKSLFRFNPQTELQHTMQCRELLQREVDARK